MGGRRHPRRTVSHVQELRCASNHWEVAEMRVGRRSSVRVLGWVGLALVMLGAVSVTAMALTASHGKVPPSKPLAVALHDAATAAPTGVTARFAVHQHLIPGSSTLLSTGPLAGATGTVWAADGKVRLSIHSAL